MNNTLRAEIEQDKLERFQKECNNAIAFIKKFAQKQVEVDGFALGYNGDRYPYTLIKMGKLVEKTVRGKQVFSLEFDGAMDDYTAIPKEDGTGYQYGDDIPYTYSRNHKSAVKSYVVKVEIDAAKQTVDVKTLIKRFNEETQRFNTEPSYQGIIPDRVYTYNPHI